MNILSETWSTISVFLSPQNAVYFMLYSLVHTILTFYIKGALKFKCRNMPLKGQKHDNEEIDSHALLSGTTNS